MLNIKKRLYSLIIVLVGVLVVTSFNHQAFGGALLDKATGKVEIQSQTLKGEQPATVPKTIFIQDFELDYENIKSDQGVLERLKSRPRVLPQLRQKNDPEQDAGNLVDLMSASLQERFKKYRDRGGKN
jgi:hypothetical protein